MKEEKGGVLPRHVAIIMDGNGRWAQKRLLPRNVGHREGMNRMIALSEHLFDRGVEICTVFALSTENLSRPQEELDGLYSLFCTYFEKNVEKLLKKGIALRAIGNLALLPPEIESLVKDGTKRTAGGKRGTLVLAIAYGGRQDILAAVNEAVRRGKEVTETEFSAMLSTDGLPDPDLLIRTGRELRISNFLLWQSAYTEFYFTDTLFPDFDEKELDKALAAYGKRKRKFGKI